MHQVSSRHLSQDFAAWKGLSLRELFWIVLTTTPMVAVLFAFLGSLTGYPLAFGCLGFLLGFILAITIWPKHIARLKAGKPAAYMKKKVLLQLVSLHLIKSPWMHYQGRWQTAKRLGGHDV